MSETILAGGGGRAVLVIMDGIGYDTATSQCGFLEGSVEAGKARRWRMRSVMPSVSAPVYESLHTGLAPVDHGIVSNEAIRPSTVPNVFGLARAAGLETAAVASDFFFTLYCGRHYDKLKDVEVDDDSLGIQHGRFFSMEGARPSNLAHPADIDLCAQANLLIARHAPHYLLLHMSAGDALGHIYGGDSAEYRVEAWYMDDALARVVPGWVAAGYQVFVTADHGMNADKHHGGAEDVMRSTAFYYFGPRACVAPDTVLDQRCIAPDLLRILGLSPAAGMDGGSVFA